MTLNEVRIELNDAGIRELLNSSGVQAFLAAKAAGVQSAASSGGGEFTVEVRPGKVRARAKIRAADYEARQAESENQILTRAGHSSGGAPGKG